MAATTLLLIALGVLVAGIVGAVALQVLADRQCRILRSPNRNPFTREQIR